MRFCSGRSDGGGGEGLREFWPRLKRGPPLFARATGWSEGMTQGRAREKNVDKLKKKKLSFVLHPPPPANALCTGAQRALLRAYAYTNNIRTRAHDNCSENARTRTDRAYELCGWGTAGRAVHDTKPGSRVCHLAHPLPPAHTRKRYGKENNNNNNNK